jgi:hypothetical protein
MVASGSGGIATRSMVSEVRSRVRSGRSPLEQKEKLSYALPAVFFLLPIDQGCLLPSAWVFVGAVNAARPAAGSLLPFQQFAARSLDSTLARRRLLRIIDPADKLIPAERAQTLL